MGKPRWKILKEAEYAYLDTINLKPLLCKNIHKHIFEIMDLIRDTYSEDYRNKNTIGDNDVLGNISHIELLDYIQKRYGLSYHEEILYYINISAEDFDEYTRLENS